MKKIIFASLFLLAACATVKPLYIRDGVQVYRATCNGWARDIGDCYALASEQCAGNFEVVNSIENETDNFFAANNTTETKRTTYWGNTKVTTTDPGINYGLLGNGANKLINRSLFFYCK